MDFDKSAKTAFSFFCLFLFFFWGEWQFWTKTQGILGFLRPILFFTLVRLIRRKELSGRAFSRGAIVFWFFENWVSLRHYKFLTQYAYLCGSQLSTVIAFFIQPKMRRKFSVKPFLIKLQSLNCFCSNQLLKSTLFLWEHSNLNPPKSLTDEPQPIYQK